MFLKTKNCYRCRYLRTGWDPALPYSCDLLGFRSLEMPSRIVWESTGADCRVFEEKPARPGEGEKPPEKDPLTGGRDVDLEA